MVKEKTFFLLPITVFFLFCSGFKYFRMHVNSYCMIICHSCSDLKQHFSHNITFLHRTEIPTFTHCCSKAIYVVLSLQSFTYEVNYYTIEVQRGIYMFLQFTLCLCKPQSWFYFVITSLRSYIYIYIYIAYIWTSFCSRWYEELHKGSYPVFTAVTVSRTCLP